MVGRRYCTGNVGWQQRGGDDTERNSELGLVDLRTDELVRYPPGTLEFCPENLDNNPLPERPPAQPDSFAR